MKFFSGIVEFGYSWIDVASSLIRRYPNPYSKHVLTEDVIERYVEDGKLHTVKLLTKTNPLPRWGERFYRGPNFVTIVEESVVDPIAKSFTTYTRNITMHHFMSCTEKCTYKLNETNPQNTIIEKKAWLDSSVGYGLRIPILEFSIKRYRQNQHKATLGLEHVITNTEPQTLRTIVKHSKEKLSETAKHSKEIISQKAKQASELARSKADKAKLKAHEVNDH